MKFLRTASTGRLLATIVGLVVAIAAGTAIAVAATGSGPVPKREPLARAIHQGLTAPPVTGITANISFTNNLIDSSDFTGDNKDPILQGASGRLWLSGDRHLRIELQSDNGDSQLVVNGNSFWISDPMSNTVYEGTLPPAKSDRSGKAKPAGEGVPSIAKIQSELARLMKRVNLTGAQPTDVGGQAAYRVKISPKHDGGLLGSAQVAWDALRGVPLEVGIYARGNSTPVLDLKATNISYGAVPASDFSVSPPSGAKVVKVSTAGKTGKAGMGSQAGRPSAAARHARKAHVSGVASVADHVPFTLAAPRSLVGLPRHDTTLLDMGGKPAALVTYGQNLGGMLVIEQRADAGKAAKPSSGAGPGGLSLPTVSINGSTGQELSTALGTVVRFNRGGVAYTVIGSVPAAAAEQAARALAP
jgi:outer membrane lipoprotein-sorting protein